MNFHPDLGQNNNCELELWNTAPKLQVVSFKPCFARGTLTIGKKKT